MTMKPEWASVAAVALIVALAGCGSSATTEGSNGAPTGAQTSSSSPTPPAASAAPDATSASPDAAPSAPAAEPVVITIKGFKYTVPASVAPGAKVTVKNGDGEKHTLTSAPKGVFDVAAFGGGTATFSAPTKPGSYPFTCTLHADMDGTLIVR